MDEEIKDWQIVYSDTELCLHRLLLGTFQLEVLEWREMNKPPSCDVRIWINDTDPVFEKCTLYMHYGYTDLEIAKNQVEHKFRNIIAAARLHTQMIDMIRRTRQEQT